MEELTISQEKILFKLYAQQLTKLMPEFVDTFLCPYCFKKLYIEDLSPDKEGIKRLTKAHIVPNAVGGKQFVLACKDCNNNLGEILDSTLAVEWEKHTFLKGKVTDKSKSKFKWRAEINGVDIGMELKSTSNGQVVNISGNPLDNPKITNPANFSLANYHVANAIFAGKPINVRLKTAFKDVDEHLLGVTLLNIAYLRCFQFLGYHYILSEALTQIRSQILSPYEKIITKPFLQRNSKDPIPEWGLNFFGEGLLAPSYALQWGGYLVFLPLNDDINLKIYSKIENYLKLLGPLTNKVTMDAGKYTTFSEPFIDKLEPWGRIELNITSDQKILVIGGLHSSAKSVIETESKVIDWEEVKKKKSKT